MTRLESHRTRTKLVDIVKVAVSVGIYMYIVLSLGCMHIQDVTLSEAFMCRLYALKSSSIKVNYRRYDMFSAKRGEIQSYQLPPCRECLVKHAQRANYQAAIWRRCLEQDPKVPSHVGRGWKIEKEEGVEQVVVHSLHWMDEQPLPQAVLDLLA